MRYSSPRCRLAQLAVVIQRHTRLHTTASVLARLRPSSKRRWGVLSDLTRCRNENAAAVVTTVDDETHSAVRVNEVQTEGCMTKAWLGAVSTAVAWSPPLWLWPCW